MITEEDFLPATERSMVSRFGGVVRWLLGASFAYGLDWYDMLGHFGGSHTGGA